MQKIPQTPCRPHFLDLQTTTWTPCLVQSLADHAPQELKGGDGIGGGQLSIGIWVEPVVGGGQEEAILRVKALLDQVLHEVLEQAASVHPRLRHPVRVYELDAHAVLEVLT